MNQPRTVWVWVFLSLTGFRLAQHRFRDAGRRCEIAKSDTKGFVAHSNGSSQSYQYLHHFPKPISRGWHTGPSDNSKQELCHRGQTLSLENLNLMVLAGDFIFHCRSLYKHSAEQKTTCASLTSLKLCKTPESHRETSPYKAFLHNPFVNVFSISLGENPKNWIAESLDVYGTIRTFPKVIAPFYTPTNKQCMRVPVFSTLLTLVLLVFSI